MRIAVRFKDDVAILSLSGKFLAGSDGPYMRQKVKDLIEAGTEKLIINFADVPYIDSTGLGFLAGARVTAQNANVRIVLADLNQHVLKILDGVNLTQFFTMAPDEAAALKMLSQPEAAASKADSGSGKVKSTDAQK